MSENTWDRMRRNVGLELRVLGGTVVARHASVGSADPFTVTLKCEQAGSFIDGTTVTIGNERHFTPKLFVDDDDSDEKEDGWRLNTLPIIVALQEPDAAWLEKNKETADGDPLVGRFDYHPRAAHAGRDVRPIVDVWIAMGPDTIRMIRDRLMRPGSPDFSIGLGVRFPEDVAQEQGVMGRWIAWDGEGNLPIISASVAWELNDWSPGFLARERSAPPEPVPPSPEHLAVLSAIERLESVVSRLATPLWLAVGALVALAIFRR